MEKIIEVEGSVNDLLTVSPDGTMKCANIVYLGDDKMNPDSEIFHFSITSTVMNGQHEKFDMMLEGKHIKITVETIDE